MNQGVGGNRHLRGYQRTVNGLTQIVRVQGGQSGSQQIVRITNVSANNVAIGEDPNISIATAAYMVPGQAGPFGVSCDLYADDGGIGSQLCIWVEQDSQPANGSTPDFLY